MVSAGKNECLFLRHMTGNLKKMKVTANCLRHVGNDKKISISSHAVIHVHALDNYNQELKNKCFHSAMI